MTEPVVVTWTMTFPEDRRSELTPLMAALMTGEEVEVNLCVWTPREKRRFWQFRKPTIPDGIRGMVVRIDLWMEDDHERA